MTAIVRIAETFSAIGIFPRKRVNGPGPQLQVATLCYSNEDSVYRLAIERDRKVECGRISGKVLRRRRQPPGAANGVQGGAVKGARS